MHPRNLKGKVGSFSELKFHVTCLEKMKGKAKDKSVSKSIFIVNVRGLDDNVRSQERFSQVFHQEILFEGLKYPKTVLNYFQ